MDAFGRKIVKFGLKFLKDPLEFSILFIAEKTERRTAQTLDRDSMSQILFYLAAF